MQQKMVLGRWYIPTFRVVRVHVSTGYNSEEGIRRALRNGRVSDVTPEIPIRFATFASLQRSRLAHLASSDGLGGLTLTPPRSSCSCCRCRPLPAAHCRLQSNSTTRKSVECHGVGEGFNFNTGVSMGLKCAPPLRRVSCRGRIPARRVSPRPLQIGVPQ